VTRRLRLDAELVRRGLARSRDHAAELVSAGRVRVGGSPAAKPATAVDTASAILVTGAAQGGDYVSRGAHKLAGALDRLGLEGAGPVVAGRRCLDAGASTGGFTEVLLHRGAAAVVAVDVGYGQLAWPLATDPRVTVLDRTNVRDLQPEVLAGRVDLTVADLSFISLRLVLPALRRCTAEAGDLLLMVKPQFEVGRGRVGPGGVVRDPGLRRDAVLAVAHAAADLDLGTVAATASPLPGPSGNVEYFLWLRAGAPPVTDDLVRRAVEAGPR
jgi:23S rRNA (cytidine1920-2'-O)/16S rRNA (cytidine1409-2'-O)-methyltransferase